MMEPPWQTKLVKIKQDDGVQYIAAMFVWFQHWKIRSGAWPSLPQCDFTLNWETIDTVNLCPAPTLAKMDLSLGELQTLKVLTTFQCLAKIGPLKLVPGMISHCVELIMRQLMVLDISFSSQTVLGSTVSTWLRSTPLETHVSLADISSLPLSIGSAGYMH